MGGGLGGGSSDAATVLLGLNALWDLRLGRDDLKRLGLSLGADIPVFLGGESAWAEGVGEKLTPFPVPEAWYVVITPPVAVSTALVFSAPELTRNTPRTTMSGFSVGVGRNDLEPVVMARFPEVKEALMWLRRFGDAQMSGSGSSVFVPLLSEEEALACFEARPSGWTGFIAQGVQDHPLKNWP
jgi:4-diphosphocytidyl-2-C-methyl-D-erythritol kinase